MLLYSANCNAEHSNFNAFQNNIICYYAFILKFSVSTDNVNTINNAVYPTTTLIINSLNTVTTTTSWATCQKNHKNISRNKTKCILRILITLHKLI